MITARRLGDYARFVAWVLWACAAVTCIHAELRTTQIIRDAVAQQQERPQ
ncbi:UNVERIFIED_ORG: hypothetical protein ABIC43_000226 [Variovorax guangxiensis]